MIYKFKYLIMFHNIPRTQLVGFESKFLGDKVIWIRESTFEIKHENINSLLLRGNTGSEPNATVYFALPRHDLVY